MLGCRVSSGSQQRQVWCPRPACFLETECHALPRHVVPRSQGATMSPDDVMWWRSAIKQVPLAKDSLSPVRFWNRATST